MALLRREPWNGAEKPILWVPIGKGPAVRISIEKDGKLQKIGS